MNDKPTPVAFRGVERIELQNCYVFRDNLAHKANVSIASAVSFTDDPHLFHISIAVPGSRKMTLQLGIPFSEALKLSGYAVMWNNSLQYYDSCRFDVVSDLFDRHIADLTAFPWTVDDLNTVRDMDVHNDMQAEVKADLLSIAEASLEGAGIE